MAVEAAKLPRPRKIKTPLLVLGAKNDRVFTVAEQRKTEAILYDVAHDMMLERGWRAVVDQILGWLASRNL